jgi:hypothetical protein
VKAVIKKKKLLLIIIFFISSALIFSIPFSVETTGLGDIVNGKKEIAREKAVENALRLAVEQAVGTLISQESMVRNGELIEDSIFKKSQGFIKSYEILNERIDNDYEVVWVTLRAEVMTTDIQQSLRDIIESLGTITTFLYIDGNRTFNMMLVNLLTENGIEVIDPDQLQTITDRQKFAMLQDESESIEDASLWFGTQYIIRGQAEDIIEQTTSFGYQVSDLYFKYDIELIDAITAQRLGSFSDIKRSQGNTSRDMLQLLIDESLQSLQERLPGLFIRSETDRETIEFIVVGINDFEKRLEEISQITSLQNVEAYGERQKYKLRYSGNLNTLLKRLEELGYSVERYQNSYYIKKISTEIKVEIKNASFSDLKQIRAAFKDLNGLNYSNKTIIFLTEKDIYVMAEKLDALGYAILELNTLNITAQKGE